MFYHLFYPLRESFGALNIFGYISFRAAMAAVTAFTVSMIAGPPVIRFLRSKRVVEDEGKTDSGTLNEIRSGRSSVPTMGGGVLLAAILLSTLLWARLDNRLIQLGLLGTLAFGLIGFVDDYIKLRYYYRKGLEGRSKFKLQMALSFALTLAVFVYLRNSGRPEAFRLYLPVGKGLYLGLGVWGGVFFFLFALFFIVGTSNAVNLTDGMDGLAPGLLLITSSAMAVICYVGGRPDFAAYLKIPHVPGGGELTIFCAGMTGATMGFLWFNCYPAQVFMGDTGSLSLGGLLGFIAVTCKQELVLVLVGGVFYVEVLSVILQVASCKLRHGKRVFLCAPLHHHFQFMRAQDARFRHLEDAKITVRFWIVGIIMAILGLSTLKMH